MLHDWTERLGQTKKGCLGKTTVEPSSIDYTSYMYICLIGPSVEGLEDEISLAAYGQSPYKSSEVTAFVPYIRISMVQRGSDGRYDQAVIPLSNSRKKTLIFLRQIESNWPGSHGAKRWGQGSISHPAPLCNQDENHDYQDIAETSSGSMVQWLSYMPGLSCK